MVLLNGAGVFRGLQEKSQSDAAVALLSVYRSRFPESQLISRVTVVSSLVT